MMMRSLGQYARYFYRGLTDSMVRSMLIEERSKLKNFQEYLLNDTRDKRRETFHQALYKCIGWLGLAQDVMEDDGIGSYHLIEGWGSSYPETTGYIIPSLLTFAERYDVPEARERALKAAEWLLGIQKPEGGWQSMRIDDDRPPVVFNTGQVIRGMIAVYDSTGEERFLKAAEKAADWLCSIQNERGYWDKHVFLGVSRVYDTYVDAPLIQLYDRTGKEVYKEAACRNLDYVVDRQSSNGWFPDCDNTIKRNDEPILHTIAYTIDGLLDSGLYLDDPRYIEAARKPANLLMDRFFHKGILMGRYNKSWQGKEHFITTGGAQMAVIWGKLYRMTGEGLYLNAMMKMNQLLCYVQERRHEVGCATEGALQGSFPLWGRYEKFAFPNWATKYFIDSLLLHEELEQGSKNAEA